MNHRRRRRVALLVAAASVGALLLVALAVARTSWPSRFLCPEDPPAAVDAAVVLAGDPDWERIDTASRMVLAGEARLLIVSGGFPGPGDSAASLRARALKNGVPADRIHAEESSLSTRECVLALRPVLERLDIRRVALVTSPFHQRRAGMAARAAWPDVVVLDRPARSPWKHEGWWKDPVQRSILISEYAKLGYYGARGWLHFGRSS